MRSRLSETVRYLIALALGTFIFFWTEDPLPGVILSSLQAGWNSLAAGFWLLRVDQQRSRARICFLFQISAAGWQVAAAALVSVLFMAAAGVFLGIEPNMDRFAATMWSLISGVCLCTFLGLAAAIDALWNDVRVWTHPRLSQDWEETEQGNWLLLSTSKLPRRFNYAVFVAGTSLVTPIIVVGIAVLIAVTAKVDNLAIVPTVAGFALVFGGPILMIFVYAWVSPRIIARNPWNCWPAGSFQGAPRQAADFASAPRSLTSK